MHSLRGCIGMDRELIMKYLNSSTKEEDFKDILDQSAQKNKDFIIECLLQLKSSNFDQLEQLLDDTYQLRELLTDILQNLSDRDLFFYQICSYINTWNVFNKILEIEVEKENLNTTMLMILDMEPFARELLRYLYRNPGAERSNINKAFYYHSTEFIENILNIICDKNIVYKTSIGNYAVYDLTENSRRWVEKNIENRIYKAWSAEIPSKTESNNITVTVKPTNFPISSVTKETFGSVVGINHVCTTTVQPQEIFKFSLENDIVFPNSTKEKYKKLNKMQFEKESKHGEFEMAGPFKHTK